MKKIIIAATALLLAAGGVILWEKMHRVPLEEKYRTAHVEKGDVAQAVTANGTLNPVVLVNVGTQVSGTVMKLHVDFNDPVKKDQILMELEPSLYRQQVNGSEASVKNAAAALDLAVSNEARIRDLRKQEYATSQEMDQAEQMLKSARAQLDLARAQNEKDRTNLSYTVIRSPVSGVVVSRDVDVGQTVAASFQTPTLFRIAQDLGKMQIDSNFAEADVGSIRVGQAARFTVDAFPGRLFQGKVRQIRINPTIQSNVVTYDVVVAVDNPDKILFPGMTAYVSIIVAQRQGALLVPNAALRFRPPSPDKKGSWEKGTGKKEKPGMGVVYILEQGKFRPVPIGAGITDNKFTEVASGDLKEGDHIVVEEAAPSDGGGPPKSFQMRTF